jgi:hypothetical protein
MNVFKRKGRKGKTRCVQPPFGAEREDGRKRASPEEEERALRRACPIIRSRNPPMAKPAEAFDFRKPVAHDAAAKRAFHTAAQRQLRQVARALGLTRSHYKLRLTAGSSDLSGEIALHSDRLYVQASQPAGRINAGILFRTCHGRDDLTGGENHYASLDLLNQPEQLARLIRQVCDV